MFVLILISKFLRICIYELGIFHAIQPTKCLRNQGRSLVHRKLVEAPPPPPSNFRLAVPRWLFCFGSMEVLDVVCHYLWLFSLYIKIGKIDVKG